MTRRADGFDIAVCVLLLLGLCGGGSVLSRLDMQRKETEAIAAKQRLHAAELEVVRVGPARSLLAMTSHAGVSRRSGASPPQGSACRPHGALPGLELDEQTPEPTCDQCRLPVEGCGCA